MAIRDVVTRGFGNGTYSPGVTKVPTRGYSPALTPLGACWAEGQTYDPGYKAGQVYKPGFQEGQAYAPGYKTGQGYC